jgi:hypothetical protein
MLRLFAQEFRQGFQGGKRRERSAHRLRSCVLGQPSAWIGRFDHDFEMPAHGGSQA